MHALKPIIGAMALALLLAARTAPDLAESLMLSAAEGLAGGAQTAALSLFSDCQADAR